MTTAELIKALADADPSGRLRVTVKGDGDSPYCAERAEHYYDGREVLVEPRPWRAVAIESGHKVIIRTSDLLTHFLDDPSLTVTPIGADGLSERSLAIIERAKADADDIRNDRASYPCRHCGHPSSVSGERGEK